LRSTCSMADLHRSAAEPECNIKHSVNFTKICVKPFCYFVAIQKHKPPLWITSTTPSHEKIFARNSIYIHAHDFTMSNVLLLAILIAFVPQVNKQQTMGFQVFTHL
jgi:hypothetical protein